MHRLLAAAGRNYQLGLILLQLLLTAEAGLGPTVDPLADEITDYNSWMVLYSRVPSPLARSLHAACIWDDSMIVVGGMGSSGTFGQDFTVLNDTWVLDLGIDSLLWAKVSDMPLPLYSHTCTVVVPYLPDDTTTTGELAPVMLVYGGVSIYSAGSLNPVILAYDALEDEWSNFTLAQANPAPKPRQGHVAVCFNYSLLIHGGFGQTHDLLPDTWSLNVTSRTWTLLMEVGPALTAHVAWVFRGSAEVAYLAGGCKKIMTPPTYSHFSACDVQNATFQLERTTDDRYVWTQLVGLGGPAIGYGTAIVTPATSAMPEACILYGGAAEDRMSSLIYKLAQEDDQWHVINLDFPLSLDRSPTAGHTAVYNPLRDTVVAFGGWTYGAFLDSVEEFSLRLHLWFTDLSPGSQPAARSRHRGALLQGHFVIFGGITLEGPVNDAWILGSQYTEDLTWVQLAADAKRKIPNVRYGHAMVAVNNTFVAVLGGRDSIFTAHGYLNDIWLATLNNSKSGQVQIMWYELLANGSEAAAKGPQPRAFHTCSQYQGNLFVFGGFSATWITFNDLWRFHIDTATWLPVLVQGATPPPRFGHTSMVLQVPQDASDYLVIYGGAADTEEVPQAGTWAFDLSAPLVTSFPLTDIAVEAGQFPPPRIHHTASLLEVKNVLSDSMIINGGFVGSETHAKQFLDDTWAAVLVDNGTISWHRTFTLNDSPRFGHAARFLSFNLSYYVSL